MTDEEGYGEEGYTVVGAEHYTACAGHGGLSVALFFLFGAVAGAGLGLLLAPQSGLRTRRQIKEAIPGDEGGVGLLLLTSTQQGGSDSR